MYSRNLKESLLAALGDTPVVLLQGPRQCGKSTLARLLTSGTRSTQYITLDDPTARGIATGAPSDFIAGLAGPVVIDEIQLAPELFRAIKLAVDHDRKPGRFLLTGSSNILLAPRLSESLVGRMEILTLWPLSQGEIAGIREDFIDTLFSGPGAQLHEAPAINRGQLAQRIISGGYPEAVARRQPQRREAWFNSYITTILERDVRQLAAIEGLTQIPRLLTLLAAGTGGLLNVAELSRDLGFTQPTLARYLTLLQGTYLYKPLPAWFVNSRKRLVKREKVYLADTGLAAHLRHVNAARLSAAGENIGPLLESFVGQELHKQCDWNRAQPKVYYYRTADGKEVDFVLESRDGRIAGVEVKASLTVSTSDLAGMRDLAETAGNKFARGVVLYLGRQILPLGKNITAMPISSLWTPRR
jgi:predicted AAA+ superfamily ATPase